ncbi:MAG: ABC transporter ATP-binding protein [Deltaproteobacteria bacterium]|nr:ABC transporter ATP-binding protein [Deltaproteobacteria bacterium]
MSDGAVTLRTGGLVKAFTAGTHRRTLFQFLRDRFVRRSTNGRPRASLDGIDIEARAGEIIGIIGENGAGKTTLLKTIAGLYAPTAGRIEINGEVALLAGLGAGMVEELSVADNIRLYGAICRLHRRTIRDHFAHILAWSELEGFVDAELRTLSTGMRTRLAFAIAMHVDSELVLMDEAFSAGDKRFQEKCDRFFDDTKRLPRTLLVATHNLEFVRNFCDRTLWLHKGRQMAFGPTTEVLPRYETFAP